MPANMSVVDARGATITVSFGAEFGFNWMALRFSGTPSATGNVRIGYAGLQQIPALAGQVWDLSQFVTLTAGDLTNIGNIRHVHQYRNAAGSSVSSGNGNAFVPTSTRTRFNGSALAVGATIAFNEPEFSMDVTSGSAIDVTLRFANPVLRPTG